MVKAKKERKKLAVGVDYKRFHFDESVHSKKAQALDTEMKSSDSMTKKDQKSSKGNEVSFYKI